MLLFDAAKVPIASPILQFLADQKPDTALMPKAGTPERYEMLELLNYLSAEVHKSMGAMFAIGRMVSNQEAVTEFILPVHLQKQYTSKSSKVFTINSFSG